MRLKSLLFALILPLLAALPQGGAHAAATLLPNGEQCFSANTATSGGLYGPIAALAPVTGGGGYTSGTYTNVPLTGGSGFNAVATVFVAAGQVASVAISNPGSHYAAADVLSASTALLGGTGAGFSVSVAGVATGGTGMVGLLGPITAGTGGTAGTYGGVALTGGTGSGATANITVSGGGVTAVTILNPGAGYVVADTLSAASGSIGGVSGFSVPVASVTINNAVVGGTVSFYTPGTQTFKQTWFNADQGINHQNANPVQLDGNGCAIIYGSGSYRQVLKDSLGNVIWDQITTDTAAGNNFWGNYAGAAGGTANAITLTAPNFSFQDGQIISFRVTATNTGATTINPSGGGGVSVVHDLSTGPVTLTGGELVATNVAAVQYDQPNNEFHIVSPVFWPASSSIPVGTVLPYAGFGESAPLNYALAQGQCVSRSVFAALFAALTSQQTATLNGTTTITGLADTSQMYAGLQIEGAGIPAGATIASVVSSSSITISSAATTSGTATVTVFAYQHCDGATTFGLPDYRGLVMAGVDSLGTPSDNLQVVTTVTTTNGSADVVPASTTGLAGGMLVVSANIPAGYTISCVGGTSGCASTTGHITLSSGTNVVGASGTAARFSLFQDARGIGAFGGSYAHQQQVGELAAHTHTITDPGHTHAPGSPGTSFAEIGTGSTSNAVNTGSGTAATATASATTGITINATPANSPMLTMPPTRLVNYMIRINP